LYEWVGSWYGKDNSPYVPPMKKELARLAPDERAVYDLFYDEGCHGPKRIEQETLTQRSQPGTPAL
jgi:hypothetical protein